MSPILPQKYQRRFDIAHSRFVTETRIARVWKVQLADNSLAALKLYHRADRSGESPGLEALKIWKNTGDAAQPVVLEGRAVLLSWLEGPTLGDLSRAGQDDIALGYLAGLAKRLHTVRPATVAPFRTVTRNCRALLEPRIAESCPAELRNGILRARHIAQALLDSAPAPRFLHGDLHQDNIILTRHDRPVAIDPKGLWGDPSYEFANLFRNPKGMKTALRDPRLARARAQFLADTLSDPTITPHRLLCWAAAKVALSIAWQAEEKITQSDEADLLMLFLDLAGKPNFD